MPINDEPSSDYKRIYFFHIRRVGGTSLNQTFFQLRSAHPALVSATIRRSSRKVINLSGLKHVGANQQELELGDYLYGFSHIPFQALRLPPETFTITLLRDPVERVLSHYRMILAYDLNGIQRPWLPLERKWLGNSFGDFIQLVPRERLYAQLFMFSRRFHVPEAAENVQSCSFAFATEHYAAGLKRLSDLLNMPLSMRHAHSTKVVAPISIAEIERLRQLMEPEYELLRQLESVLNGR